MSQCPVPGFRCSLGVGSPFSLASPWLSFSPGHRDTMQPSSILCPPPLPVGGFLWFRISCPSRSAALASLPPFLLFPQYEPSWLFILPVWSSFYTILAVKVQRLQTPTVTRSAFLILMLILAHSPAHISQPQSPRAHTNSLLPPQLVLE